MDKEYTLQFGVVAACLVVFGMILHAVTIGVTFEAMHRPQKSIAVPAVEVIREESFKAGDIPNSTVNIHARDEKKEQCGTCNQGYVATVPGGTVVYHGSPTWGAPGLYRSEGTFYAPVVQSRPASQLPSAPSTSPVVGQPVAAGSKPVSKYQVALFVDSSARSNQVLQWFSTYPALVNLRKSVQYQIYTADHPMYRERFSAVVPRDAFPVVMFLRPDGGHIHVAGNSDIPATPEALYADLRQGWMYAEEMKSVSLQRRPPNCPDCPDCPDGNCPDVDEPEPDDESPRFPILRRPLLDRNKDKEGVVWDFMWGGKEIQAAILVLVVLAVMVVVAAV